MRQSEKFDLMMAGVVLLSLAGFGNFAAWLLEHILITSDVKAMLFLSWLIGLVSWLPAPFNAIAILGIIAAIGFVGVGAFKVAGSIWYSITQ